ncbi:PASTA domain-containing protein [Gordonia phthalatica]|uniref:PASTA domain-containing protein n=1 Tax=Gordonia phthalatica TaxID=1136941 RepID=A0A0N9NA49_9ACTN|nr:PASTA domain-containing protein [Gordonia phthalatica]ALG84208.1 hypothetical protein ACH46_06410 [Gordonia phthalatica]
MRRHVITSLLAVSATVLVAGCGGSTDTSTTATTPERGTTVAAPAQAERATDTTAPETTKTAPAATAADAVMPNVVCMNLQDAQNAIQKAGVFFSRSKDASGQGRRQVLDRNWIVVAQTPDAGSPVGEGEAVLSAVKIGEPNPC